MTFPESLRSAADDSNHAFIFAFLLPFLIARITDSLAREFQARGRRLGALRLCSKMGSFAFRLCSMATDLLEWVGEQ